MAFESGGESPLLDGSGGNYGKVHGGRDVMMAEVVVAELAVLEVVVAYVVMADDW